MLRLQRLHASIDSGDIQIIHMNIEGDGEQRLKRFRRRAEKVQRELMPSMRLADIFICFADDKVQCSRAFYYLLVMEGAEVAAALL